MQQRNAFMITMVAAVAVAAACGGDDATTTPPPVVVSKIVKFSASLNAAQETPTPVGNPTGTGTFTATLDTSTNVFIWTITGTGLTPNLTAGHIHGPAAAGVPAGVVLNFVNGAGVTSALATGGTSASAAGTVTLNAATTISATVNGDSLKKLLLAGLTYANLHTTANGGGEIRGQITKVP